jgi:DNA-binding transcriptional LysR family regulator
MLGSERILESSFSAPPNLDLDAVRVFVAIVESGSFQGAARRLGLPRSTVSWRIASLESALGVQLLSRTTRRVGVTDAGRAYYHDVHAALQAVEDANRRVAGLAATPRGPVRVSASVSFGATWMNPIIQRVAEQYPAVDVVVHLTDRYVDLVAEGFDAAIRGGELPDSSLTARSLGAIRARHYAAPAYLRGRPPLDAPRDLAQHEVLLYSGGPRSSWAFEGPERLVVPVSGRYTVNNHALPLDAAVRGLGVTRTFPFLAAGPVADGSLVEVLPGWSAPPSRLHALTLGASRRTAALEAFLRVLLEVTRGDVSESLVGG